MSEGFGRRVATVTVEPAGVEFDIGPHETVLAAATRQGYRWPTVCGGMGTCHTCTLTVVDGEEHLSEIGEWEAEGLSEINATWTREAGPRRMACQVEVSGDVRVRKHGVRKSEASGADGPA
jgi:2Fe-2S ferredoxin